jgi:lysophospholipase L1-like esterase
MNTSTRHAPAIAIRSAIVLAILVAASLVVLAARSSADDTGGDGLTYIALGDSVPSGNELPEGGVGPCQRGADAYPFFVLEGLSTGGEPVRFIHLACSGARVVDADVKVDECERELPNDADDALQSECAQKDLAEQVDAALEEIEGSSTLMTLTIGANDTAWTEPLAIVSLLLSTDDEFHARISEISANVERDLGSQVDRLVNADDDVNVILTGYYNPLNSESILYDLVRGAQTMVFGPGEPDDAPCTGIDREGVEHTLSCADRFQLALEAVNRAIEAVAERHPGQARFIPLMDRFTGHESPAPVCGRAEPQSGESFIRGEVGSGMTARPDCFHPNTAGALAIATEILASLPADR